MKSMKEINEIIDRMSSNVFQMIVDDDCDAESLDWATAKAGYMRLLRHLDEAGLTWTEWRAWADAE